MSIGRHSVNYGIKGTKALVTKIILLTIHLKKRGRKERKADVTPEQVRQIFLHQRTNIRSVASALKLTATKVHYKMIYRILKPNYNALKHISYLR